MLGPSTTKTSIYTSSALTTKVTLPKKMDHYYPICCIFLIIFFPSTQNSDTGSD